MRVVVLLSGTGTLCQALFDAIDDGTVDAEVVAVVSDQRDAQGLERARSRGISLTLTSPLASITRSVDPDKVARMDWNVIT